jgi:hypothetical protein
MGEVEAICSLQISSLARNSPETTTILLPKAPVGSPHGLLQNDKDDPKQGSVYGPCKLFGFELEMAVLVGGPLNAFGRAANDYGTIQ